MKAAYAEPAELVIPGLVGMESAGTRMLADETLIVADVSNNEVVAVTKAGGKEVLASGLSYPNGVAIGQDGLVYVAEQSGGRVVRIEPSSKSSEVLAEDLINPNGLAFSPDQRTLYVSSFIGGMIYQIVFDDQGKPAPATVLADEIGKDGHGGLDGVGVDACGNVYVTEFSTANVWRITPDGKVELAVALSSETSWIPNLSWGSGVSGWDPKKMYVLDRGHDQVFAVEIGVGSAKLPHL
jgi:gluconolactonase